MICTGVVPCLSSGLAKNGKIGSMFVLFSQLFSHFESLVIQFQHGVHQAVKQDVFIQVLEGTTIK